MLRAKSKEILRFLKRSIRARFENMLICRFVRKTRSQWIEYAERRKKKASERQELLEWQRRGRPVPPPHVFKQQVLLEHAKQFNLRVLVETGTYLGDMVEATKRFFDKIYTIELSQDLFEKAKRRFKFDQHVEVIQGDSGEELGDVLMRLDSPALFWLDGHYSAGVTARGANDTPIYEELAHILISSETRHVIIIDDARCFGTNAGYPTVDELRKYVLERRRDVEVVVQDDSIRIIPKRRNDR